MSIQYARAIVNPEAGGHSVYREWPRINKYLINKDLLLDYVYTEDIGHATELARAAANTDYRYIIAAGGETTVVIRGKPGCGGSNQEFVIGAALKLDESDRAIIAAIDSNGTDGPTSIAGGIVDASTVTRARKQWYDIFAHLVHHNTSSILQKLSDAIITGHTGTNVNDLQVMLVR